MRLKLQTLKHYSCPLALLLLLPALLLVANPVDARAQGSRRVLVSSPALRPGPEKTRQRLLELRRRVRGVATLMAPPPPDGESLTEKKSVGENPTWRLNWFLFQRTFPNETLPTQGRFFAYSELSQPTEQPTPPIITETWRPIGPIPITQHTQRQWQNY